MYSLWIALNKYIAELMGLEDFEEDEELGEQETPESRVRPLDLPRRQTI